MLSRVSPTAAPVIINHTAPALAARFLALGVSIDLRYARFSPTPPMRRSAGTAHEPFMREMLKNVVQIAINEMAPESQS
ncbi:hypothetical protein [Phreatobacter oligotrophus]|uniref:Uncharacterized protein n=1 Tax=Phreatobacter oligotrophus TaxID=1122261 RepID=A0A2T4YWE1_9HYPH|nr:hypothetical protein [Phreatobacter oligotrophus]PTM48443.1 hypothetical protein C8P69_1256 [Phreatobacter oligotrophus]